MTIQETCFTFCPLNSRRTISEFLGALLRGFETEPVDTFLKWGTSEQIDALRLATYCGIEAMTELPDGGTALSAPIREQLTRFIAGYPLPEPEEKYVHYGTKDTYQVVMLGQESDPVALKVGYKNLRTGRGFMRAAREWFQLVDSDGQRVPRYKRV